MRKVIDLQMEFWKKDIANIDFDLQSRKVFGLKDQYGFLLHHRVMQQQTDDKVAVAMVQGAKDRFEYLVGCNFDKGFYRPDKKSQQNLSIKKIIRAR